jgi:heme-degrading monooxygenase HmoA
MSVLMILRVPTDAASFEAVAADNRDAMKGIAERAQEQGAIHHNFYEGDGEVLIVDEWDSPESFQRFFEQEGPTIGPLMAQAGATVQSQPSFHRPLSVGDQF